MAQINKPDLYFNTVLYTGDGTNSRAVTGVGFQPDFSWLKNRTGATAYHHQTFDSVRGASAGTLYTSLSNAEDTNYTISSFDSDGITLRATSHDSQNESGGTYASWNWLASNTTASNTDGSITSTVSVNTTSGFSIVSYTGTFVAATIGHGLGVAPKMIIIKQRNNTRNWVVGHDSIGWTKYLYLDSTQASNTGNLFNNTAPTNSVFSIVGGDSGVNASGGTYIAYCFAEKQGFSKFGSYTGNGNADGTFVYTGFKPAFVICKRTNGADDWFLLDNKRDIDNPANHWLMADSSNAEQTSPVFFDFLSNGFKNRGTGGGNNASGGTYIYMAFAENPLVGTNNIPATAR